MKTTKKENFQIPWNWDYLFTSVSDELTAAAAALVDMAAVGHASGDERLLQHQQFPGAGFGGLQPF
jgi:hypothetical protein